MCLLLGNNFLTELISFEFNFHSDDELTDYFVNFLKAMTLRLDNETINFFFNDRLRTFPLLQAALTLYNSKEQLVRTSVRSIVLTIFGIDNPHMQALFHMLPFAAFYANLACHLRDLWLQIEIKIEEITADDQARHMESVIKQAEDANETLFFIQDLLETTKDINGKVHSQIKNALLNYAYYPTVIQSLCSLKLKPQLSIQTCLYILQ